MTLESFSLPNPRCERFPCVRGRRRPVARERLGLSAPSGEDAPCGIASKEGESERCHGPRHRHARRPAVAARARRRARCRDGAFDFGAKLEFSGSGSLARTYRFLAERLRSHER
ncbi:MAG: hypothetical protein NVSMB59_09240 [Vulcanimicrobiaceae bacterium]